MNSMRSWVDIEEGNWEKGVPIVIMNVRVLANTLTVIVTIGIGTIGIMFCESREYQAIVV